MLIKNKDETFDFYLFCNVNIFLGAKKGTVVVGAVLGTLLAVIVLGVLFYIIK